MSWQAGRPYKASVGKRIFRQIAQSCHQSRLGRTCKAPSNLGELQPLFWPVSGPLLRHPEFSGLRIIDRLALRPQLEERLFNSGRRQRFVALCLKERIRKNTYLLFVLHNQDNRHYFSRSWDQWLRPYGATLCFGANQRGHERT